MKTVKDIEKLREIEIAKAEASLAAFKIAWEKKVEVAKSFGGYCEVDEAAHFLECSPQRISFLKCRGTFRSCPDGLSLADVKIYKSSRQVGRPRKVARS